MKTGEILCIGAVNIDRVYSVSEIAQEGTAINCNRYMEFWGGKGLNQIVALHCAGASPHLYAKVGSKDYANLTSFLDSRGISSSNIYSVEGHTNHGVIQVTPSGKTSIIGAPSCEINFSKEEIDRIINSLLPNDVLLLQNEINSIPYIIRRAKEKGCKVVLNPSPLDDKIFNWPLDLVDILILNQDEGKFLTGKEDTNSILLSLAQKCPEAEILLTLGENGCVFSKNGKQFTKSCFSVKAVDTTAAGDTFEGFFLANYLETDDVDYSLDIAAKAAAIIVSRIGAAEIIPSKEEVNSFCL